MSEVQQNQSSILGEHSEDPDRGRRIHDEETH